MIGNWPLHRYEHGGPAPGIVAPKTEQRERTMPQTQEMLRQQPHRTSPVDRYRTRPLLMMRIDVHGRHAGEELFRRVCIELGVNEHNPIHADALEILDRVNLLLHVAHAHLEQAAQLVLPQVFL